MPVYGMVLILPAGFFRFRIVDAEGLYSDRGDLLLFQRAVTEIGGRSGDLIDDIHAFDHFGRMRRMLRLSEAPLYA